MESAFDPKLGKETKKFPVEGNGPEGLLRKKEKKTMKALNSPYEAFEGFYPLN